ncbi:hypothetical protein [Methanocaldococcus sp.]|uniref:hypothetical protein n=1 Tax=Methanocaldococcus sp. TaxID=2152917 RepID=UPI0026184B8A|nr:hypothetical protein [Methanocaldococcus sp.]MCQ6254756.1 hypothetical protein [Methanocaldococcus sp.]
MDEMDALKAQIFAMLNQSTQEQQQTALKDNFVYFAAEAFEIDKEILGEFWGFLNKDITTSHLNEKQIEELRLLATAVYLEKYETIPSEELEEKHNREFWNLDVAVLTRGRKSIGGFLIKKATEKHVALQSEKPPEKKLW